MSAFNLLDIMNLASKEASAPQTDEYTEIYLSPFDVIPSKENFYSLEGIEELADTFLMDGQQQPTTLGRVNGKFIIVNGHRRNEANRLNVNRGYNQFSKVRYWYKDMTEAQLELCLLIGNAYNRVLSDYEKMEQAVRLKKALIKYRDEDKREITGTLRNIIADHIGVKPTQIAQYEVIDKQVNENLKEQFKSGNIGVTAAYEARKLDEEEQNELADKLQEGEKIQAKDVAALVQEKMQEQEQKNKADQKATQDAVKKAEEAAKRAQDASIQAAQATVAAERAAENADFSATNAVEKQLSESDNMEDARSVAERAMDALRSLLRKVKYISEGDAIVLEEMLIECNEKERAEFRGTEI